MSFPPPFYRWRPHPWHGLSVGPEPPKIIQAYIELTPFDLVKYEIDKETGLPACRSSAAHLFATAGIIWFHSLAPTAETMYPNSPKMVTKAMATPSMSA